MTEERYLDDKKGKYLDDKKRGYLHDTHNFVIPARDAGIYEFYQVGEYKSYVKMHHFYGKLDPSVSYLDDKIESTGMTRGEVLG